MNRVNESLPNMPRVAMYIWFFPPFIGGAEKQCKVLSEELVKRGASIFVVTERIKDTRAFELINGIEVYRVSSLNWMRRLPDYIRGFLGKRRNYYAYPAGNKDRFKALKSISKAFTHKIPNYYFFLSSLWTLYKKRDDFDIIHVHEAHWIASFGVTIARLLKKKVIVKEALSGESGTLNEQSLNSKKRAMQADLFIAISNGIFEDLVSLGIDRERISKVPNGIKVDGNKWQLNGGRKAVCITKINQLPNKGIDILLEAWRILTQKYNKDTKLQIFGAGDHSIFSRLVEDIKVGDYVQFAGFTENVKDFLLNASLFILPSRVEGLSNSLLEAMSLGLPCIASDISGNKDLIQNGINGLLVPNADPEKLAEKIAFILDNPESARELGRRAKETIEEGYTISKVADRYIELYQKLVGGKIYSATQI